MEHNSAKLFTSSFIFAFLANSLMMLAFYMLMPTLPIYLINVLGFEPSDVGIIVSSYIISAVVIRPLSGFLIDSLRRKPFYVIVFSLFTVIFGGYTLFASFAMLLVVRILQGFVWGIIIPLGNTLAIDIMPSDRRGTGIGIYGMSSNLAMALGPVVGLTLLDSLGFPTIAMVSMAASALGVLFALLIKAPRKQIEKRNEPISLDRFILVKAIPVGINVLLVCFSYGFLVAYAALYGREMGIQNVGLFFILMAIGVIASRLFTGRFIDKGFFNQIALISMALLTIGVGMLGVFQVSFIYFAMALVLGGGYGMLFPAIQTMIVNFGTHNQRGTANSTYFTGFDIGVGLGMLLGGIIADKTSLSTSLIVSSVLNLLAIIYYVKISAPSYKAHACK